MDVPGGGSGWQQLFWLVFERSSHPIALLDDERRILEVNDAGLALLGRAREKLIGTSVLDSVRPADRESAELEWEEFLQAGEYSGRRVLIRADGAEVMVDFAARLSIVEGRRLAVFVVTPAEEADCGTPGADGPAASLTKREREVVTLIALGRDTAEIAGELHISSETVRSHVRNSMAKLGVHSRAELVAVVLCGDRVLQALTRLEE